MTHLADAVRAALDGGQSPTDVRRVVEEVIHGDALAMAMEIAPDAAWDCDPQGLGYPAIQGDHWFAGVSCPAGGAVLDLAVGRDPDPNAAGWRRRLFLLTDLSVAHIEARLWLGLMVDRAEDLDPRVRARAVSAKGLMLALGWTR